MQGLRRIDALPGPRHISTHEDVARLLAEPPRTYGQNHQGSQVRAAPGAETRAAEASLTDRAMMRRPHPAFPSTKNSNSPSAREASRNASRSPDPRAAAI